MSLEFCDRTDIGRRRANNQDAKAVLEPWGREQYRRRGWLFLVADGMGAHAAGEMASQIAAEQVPLVYEKKVVDRSPPLALRASIEQANTKIHDHGESSPDLKGMGTTCTTLVIVPRGALIGHVGDSRAYRIRGERIEQLSRDHSLVWEIEELHKADPSAEMPVTPKNIITRSMGPHPHVDVDIEGPFPVEAGDVFVLCSDGLSGQVADPEIGLLAAHLPPREAAAALVGLALVRGAPDNVTLIVARASDREASKPSPQDEPWPLSDVPRAANAPAAIPWRLLAVAAGCLLGALVLSPWSALMDVDGVIGQPLETIGLRDAFSVVGAATLAVASVAALVAALIDLLTRSEEAGRALRPGERLGKGPYRAADCTPTFALVEGVVASVESAADGLGDAERREAMDAAVRARREAADGGFAAAIEAAATAIAVYTRSVEATRGR